MIKSDLNKTRRSTRVQQKRSDTRREILAAAKAILTKEGVDGVTLASVAGRLNLTKQALYHYYPSKEILIKSLVSTLLNDEIDALIAAVTDPDSDSGPLGIMIRAFYNHYNNRFDLFRIIYCQSQLFADSNVGIDALTLREEINPLTRRLFDVLEKQIGTEGQSTTERAKMRRLAFSAWMAALGLVTMLGVADANNDPLIHSDQDLLDMLVTVFDDAAEKHRASD